MRDTVLASPSRPDALMTTPSSRTRNDGRSAGAFCSPREEPRRLGLKHITTGNSPREVEIVAMRIAQILSIGAFSVIPTLWVPPLAAQTRPALDMMGAGTATCAEFLSDLRQYKGAEEIYFNWALGFMSGSNSELRLSGKPRRNLNSPEVPQEAQAQIIKRMCEANPNQRYLLIIGGLFGNLPVMKDR
jgi:hypothetical protein